MRPTIYYRWWLLMRGEHVTYLQQQLAAKGCNPGTIDGIFGPKTRDAVIAFQRASGIGVDGIVGPETWGVIEAVKKPAEGINYTKFTKGRTEYHLLKAERSKFKVDILGEPRKLQRLSSMAGGHIAAISGGFFYNTAPIGTVLKDGWTWTLEHKNYATVDLDNWVLYANGHPAIELLRGGVKNCISGQPQLLPVTHRPDSAGLEGRGPRCALGWNDRMIFAIVADGRTSTSIGATFPELAQVLRDQGATHALALDGGGTAEMIYQGRIINRPSDGRERPMPVGLGFKIK